MKKQRKKERKKERQGKLNQKGLKIEGKKK